MKKSLLAVCLLGAGMISGQVNFRLAQFYSDAFYNQEGQIEYMSFATDKRPVAAETESFIRQYVLGSGATGISVLRTEADELGYTHTRYNVTYGGAIATNKQIIAHVKDGKLISLNGDLREIAKPENQVSISESDALRNALGKVNATKYMWEDAQDEANQRIALNDPNFSYFPKGSVEVIEKDGKTYFAWKFQVWAQQPLYKANVFVDASTGSILEEQNLICTTDVPASFVTKYSGVVTATVDYTGSLYRMRETGRGLGVETYNMNGGSNYGSAVDYTDAVNSWTSTTSAVIQGGRDAHWGAEQTYDYYKQTHNRNSIDNNGYKLRSYVNYSTTLVNAFWDGTRMTYGNGTSSNGNGSWKIFTALDVCGHEITHGLTSNTGNLTYQNESGALNEAWSDIFGECIEHFGRPSQWSWKIGEDIVFGGMRDMSNPNSFGDPDTYLGTNWYTGTADNGGVHTNSNVGNFWFYLLVTGGSGSNDFGNPYNISGIGFTSAGRIAFRAMTSYFTPSTNYNAARNLTIQSAKDLFGACSNEVVQTWNSWYAVGIGSVFNPTVVAPAFYANTSNYCNVPATVSFTNLTTNGGVYTWDFGDGTSSSSVNPVHTYSNQGSYTVKLKAVGCNNLVDSVALTSLVTVNVPQPPSASSLTSCEYASATLTAVGSGSVSWYAYISASSPIATGSIYITPTLSNSATFYVANTSTSAPATGGPPISQGGGYLNNNTHWLSFDVYQNCTLNSIDVDAQTANTRVIQIKNAAGTVIFTQSYVLSIGLNTLPINLTFTPGLNYKISLTSASTSFLYRTNTNVNFPYSLGNTMKITGSSLAGNYFYFYNWNITKAECVSNKVPVNVVVVSGPTVAAFAPLSSMCIDDAPVAMNGQPAGGLFTGAGMTGNSFSPSFGAGLYPIHYTYTDNNGCSTTDSTIVMTVDACTGIRHNSATGLNVYPNPAHDQLTITGAAGSNERVIIFDATGRIVANQAFDGMNTVSIGHLANGLYLIRRVDANGSSIITTRFVKQ